MEAKTRELKQGKKVTDFEHWSYEQHYSSLNVVFNNQRTAVVAIRCHSKDKDARRPPIGGLKDGAGEQDALHKLAGPAESIDGDVNVLRSPGLGVKLWLELERVHVLEVYDPQSD